MPKSLFITGDDLRLHALDHGGRGRPLVLLHGGSAHAGWWDFLAPRFTDRFRVLAPDLRGHGDSDASPQRAYRVADYASDLGRWIAELGLDAPVLVGHSLGSFVAQHHAIEHPGSPGALVAVDGRAVFGPSGSRYMRLLRMIAPVPYPSLEEAVARFRLLPKETTASAEVLEHVARASFREAAPGRWVARFDRETLAAHEPFDFRAGLAAIPCPVLFVRGEHSLVLTRENAAAYAAACPRGEWAEISGAHHHVLLDRPDALAAEIRAFLERRLPELAGV